MIKLGQRGAAVIELQNLLNRDGAGIATDGIFGKDTLQAVLAYQAKNGLVADGIVGDQTLNTLRGVAPTQDRKTLSHSDIIEAAETLGVTVPAVLSVTEVEARKSGFDLNGNPVVLFERHVFYRQLSKIKGATFAEQIAQSYPNLCNPKPGGYLGGAAEYARLQTAIDIHAQAAKMSASYGLFQLMGFNHALCEFADVEAFYDAMHDSESQQLRAFVHFVRRKENAPMLKALKAKDWAGFAKMYNGPNYQINDYDTKLAAAYRRYQVAYPELKTA